MTTAVGFIGTIGPLTVGSSSGGVTPSQIGSKALIANAQLGGTATLPANAYILYALFRETAGFPVTVSLGTTLGATDVAQGLVVPASGALMVSISSFLKDWFSATAPQAIFVTSASWGGASINATVAYQVGL